MTAPPRLSDFFSKCCIGTSLQGAKPKNQSTPLVYPKLPTIAYCIFREHLQVSGAMLASIKIFIQINALLDPHYAHLLSCLYPYGGSAQSVQNLLLYERA
jgi:hypothetical protein